MNLAPHRPRGLNPLSTATVAAGLTNPLPPRRQDPSVVFRVGRRWLLQSNGSLLLRSSALPARLTAAPKVPV